MAILQDLQKVLNKNQVSTDKKLLDEFRKDSSFVSGQSPVCLVRPRKMEQIQKIVRLANDKGFFLLPCSSQGQRTRGDTVPLSKDTVVVDLSKMNSIVRIDRRNKVAMVEPGVTFDKLQRAADKEGLRVAMPLMPRKTKSVIGSLMEREPTIFPKYHWDMSDPLCCLEVVFGTGDMFRTGSASGPGSLEQQWEAGQAQKSPMGPAQVDWAKILQGSQGSLGIVTWTSVKLELKPGLEKAFMDGSNNLNQVIDFTYSIVKPRLPDICLILNRANLAVITGTEPDKSIPEWVVIYTISGYEYFPEDRVDYLEKDISDIAAKKGLNLKQELAGISAEKVALRLNRPSPEPFWKNQIRGGFQDIFFLSTLDKVSGFVKEMKAEVDKAGFPVESMGVYLQPVQQGRACHVEFNLFYDPENQDESRVTKELYTAASKSLIDMGGFFSRPYGEWSNLAYSKCPESVAALQKVKDIIDPNRIMNPGKLCFKEEV